MSLIVICADARSLCSHANDETLTTLFEERLEGLRAYLLRVDIVGKIEKPATLCGVPKATQILITVFDGYPKRGAVYSEVARNIAAMIANHCARIFRCQICHNYPKTFCCKFHLPTGDWITINGTTETEPINVSTGSATRLSAEDAISLHV